MIFSTLLSNLAPGKVMDWYPATQKPGGSVRRKDDSKRPGWPVRYRSFDYELHNTGL